MFELPILASIFIGIFSGVCWLVGVSKTRQLKRKSERDHETIKEAIKIARKPITSDRDRLIDGLRKHRAIR